MSEQIAEVRAMIDRVVSDFSLCWVADSARKDALKLGATYADMVHCLSKAPRVMWARHGVWTIEGKRTNGKTPLRLAVTVDEECMLICRVI